GRPVAPIPRVPGGRPYTVQCTKPPASGSMTSSASSAAPDGTPAKRNAGRSPAPRQLKRAGIRPPAGKSGLEMRSAPLAAAGALATLSSPPPHAASSTAAAVSRAEGHTVGRAIAGIIAPMRLFALRGATTVERNEADAILDGTEELMRQIMERNALGPED